MWGCSAITITITSIAVAVVAVAVDAVDVHLSRSSGATTMSVGYVVQGRGPVGCREDVL